MGIRRLHPVIESPRSRKRGGIGRCREAARRRGRQQTRWNIADAHEPRSAFDRYCTGWIAHLTRQAERACLIESVGGRYAEVIVNQRITATNGKLALCSEDLAQPALAWIRRPHHCHARSKIFVIPIPKTRPMV